MQRSRVPGPYLYADLIYGVSDSDFLDTRVMAHVSRSTEPVLHECAAIAVCQLGIQGTSR